jgi:hypothetical protein
MKKLVTQSTAPDFSPKTVEGLNSYDSGVLSKAKESASASAS